MKNGLFAPLRLDTPSAIPLAAQARALGDHLERVALRKSRILWELDTTLSRRCAELAREAHDIAWLLEEVAEDDGAVTARLNLTARYISIEAEANRIAPLGTQLSARC